jgi:outer membrane protein assembly factor BamB
VISGLTSPVDARILPGNRVLVADESASKVVEMDFRGKVIWEKTLDERPVSVQRLPNGNTFVALHSHVVEVRRDGEIVSSISIPGSDNGFGRISDANKFPDGRIVSLSSAGRLDFLTPAGKLIVSKQLNGFGGVDWLASGNVLVSLGSGAGQVLEFNPEGKQVWECKVPNGWVGTRLPDGHTLVLSKAGGKIYKVDAKGKIVWEKDMGGRPHAMHWK